MDTLGDNRPHLIAVSGNIGAGKTTVARILAQALGYRLFEERPLDNPFLPRYYAQPHLWAFHSQMWFLVRKSQQMVQISESHQGAVLERSLDEDNTVACLVLDGHEYSLYNEWFSFAKGFSLSPDIIVFLEIQPQAALQQIRKRGNSYEQEITVEFLARLGSKLEKWIDTEESTLDLAGVTTDVPGQNTECDGSRVLFHAGEFEGLGQARMSVFVPEDLHQAAVISGP